MKKVLVCGSRYWDDPKKIYKALKLCRDHGVTTIIEGGAKGADTMARRGAEELSLEVIEIEAQWKKYGVSAGPRRNAEMLKKKPDLVLAFTYNLEQSIGTQNMTTMAKNKNIPVIQIGYSVFLTPGDLKKLPLPAALVRHMLGVAQ